MLPAEIERSLRALGDDGDKVRGALERDFATYAKQAQRDRSQTRTLLLLTVGRPLLGAAAKAAASRLFSGDDRSFQERLAQIRARTQNANAWPRAGGRSCVRRWSEPRRADAEAGRALNRACRLAGRAHARLRRGRVAEWQTRRP